MKYGFLAFLAAQLVSTSLLAAEHGDKEVRARAAPSINSEKPEVATWTTVSDKGGWSTGWRHCIAKEVERILSSTEYEALSVVGVDSMGWGQLLNYKFEATDKDGKHYMGLFRAKTVHLEKDAYSCQLDTNYIYPGDYAFQLFDLKDFTRRGDKNPPYVHKIKGTKKISPEDFFFR